ncbi:MAG: SUMF1/EgtB/PvdO family nonheme iron enzyme [Chitinophagaceae bacterium]|nr:SUMF1/EgtB/PvdO family nonheme iron enzyme [Chitinophagaceae bacterium]MCB9045640.1 SUMF1/EgtB/PvdO family nonheme iron enzyme [Chitinophagales bacterium]
MKQLSLKISAVALLAFAASCGTPGNGGQLVGEPNVLNYKAPVPLGMVYVPSGVFKMGASDEDVRGKNDAMIRTVQMPGFYMDATEIANAEYRQFTNWVRDSMAHVQLGDFIDLDDGSQQVDMRKRINWKDVDLQDQLANFYIPAEASGWGKKEFDNSKLIFHYETYDYVSNVNSPAQARTEFQHKFDIPVYPDTTVWVRQLQYSYNEPIALQYNWFPAFDNYPVVGVNWHQAVAFTNWRTTLWRSEREKYKQYFEGKFQLPTEEQWEYAARGGRTETPYPWGGPYIVNKKGCYLANFKPQRGNYAADGGLYTVPVDRYWPNDFGLYNMAGNVSEWTATTYFGTAYQVVSDLNPTVSYELQENDPQWMTRKVVRGGSWRDVAFYLQNGTRDYEFADTAKAYIGFRCIYPQIYGALTNRR